MIISISNDHTWCVVRLSSIVASILKFKTGFWLDLLFYFETTWQTFRPIRASCFLLLILTSLLLLILLLLLVIDFNKTVDFNKLKTMSVCMIQKGGLKPFCFITWKIVSEGVLSNEIMVAKVYCDQCHCLFFLTFYEDIRIAELQIGFNKHKASICWLSKVKENLYNIGEYWLLNKCYQ